VSHYPIANEKRAASALLKCAKGVAEPNEPAIERIKRARLESQMGLPAKRVGILLGVNANCLRVGSWELAVLDKRCRQVRRLPDFNSPVIANSGVLGNVNAKDKEVARVR